MNRPAPSARVLRDLLGALPQIVMLVDRERKIRYINRAEIGYTIDDALGVDAIEFISPAEREEWAELFTRVLSTGEPVSRLTESIGADGERAWYESRNVGFVRKGRVAYMVIVSRNVTQRVLAERERAVLERILTMCAWCGKVQGEAGTWQTLDAYVERTTDESVTRGLCPACESATGAGG
ncbi:MAG TPA: PAS domain S-box protein [Longimicrobiales bacterium]|nr:PAS domain S-box protein [Longimicrobiales bacterium]